MTTTEAGQGPPLILGMEMPDLERWSSRVVTALGQNPSAFTGPGTNSYLVGTGEHQILLDPGDGREEYLPVLERAMELSGCTGLQEIVLTHGHPDHIGGVQSVLDRMGPLPVSKMPHEAFDAPYAFPLREISDGCVIETEGATLRGFHTPGHAPDHMCFLLEEESGLFTGDNVLGVGTTIIPAKTGNLGHYMASLKRLLALEPSVIFPAHGPLVGDACGKIRQYLAHRLEREGQIVAALEAGAQHVPEIVKIVYAAYPESLHAAAGQSVTSHLIKLEAEGRVSSTGDETAQWTLNATPPE
ncbi:MAG: beta-lactamase-like protein 2 [Myxococcota bacterium]|nr:beta-lactamase-like protein 2 [Myxococcota bacterium]